MLPRPLPTLALEDTKGDGNCAFNAFILGFCDEAVLTYLGISHAEFAAFQKEAATALALSSEEQDTWAHFQQALLSYRSRDKEQLQTLLAPLFRKLSVDLMASDRDIQASLEVTFLGAFEEFKSGRHRDDIFIKHPFIQAKFNEVAESNLSDDDARATLSTWWQTTGRTLFLEEMKKDRVWGGDAELAALAKHFNLNLNVVAPRFANDRNPEGKVKLVEDSPDAPIITLTNPYAAHWSNMRDMAVQARETARNLGASGPLPSRPAESVSRWDEISHLLEKALEHTAEVPAVSLEPYIQKNGFDTRNAFTAKEIVVRPASEAKVNLVDYDVNGKTVKVDTLTQILLDQELAKKMQAEENSKGNTPRHR